MAKQATMAKKNGKGLLALLGIGLGAFAFWKYKNMTPEEKANLKNKIDDTGKKIKDTVQDLKENISGKYDDLKKSANTKLDKMAE